MSPRWIAGFALQCSMIACGGGGGSETCSLNSDCVSGFCRADKTCAPTTGEDAAVDSSSVFADAPSAGCTPNHDGTITRAELPLAAGRSADFRVATSATWSTAGTANGDGTRTWNLAGQLSNDADETIALASPAGAWWAADFAGATYATPLSSSSNLLGVFAVSDSAVTLLGVVSPTSGSTQTELTYDPPAKILVLPFASGDAWSSSSTVSGTASGVAAFYTEAYASTVDATGTMITPYGSFPVLRISTSLTRTSGTTPIYAVNSYAWASECFGTVATVTGQDFGASGEFSDDAEVTRIAP
jgi:hypothetical protein